MYYHEFPEEDRFLIDQLLEQTDDGFAGPITPDELQDDEVFFRTRDEVEAVMSKWMDSPGAYGEMAREFAAYFDGTELDDDDMQLHDLCWGSVARVGDGRYLFWSNSWSDSGLFFQ